MILKIVGGETGSSFEITVIWRTQLAVEPRAVKPQAMQKTASRARSVAKPKKKNAESAAPIHEAKTTTFKGRRSLM